MTTCIVPLLIIFPVNVGKAYAHFMSFITKFNLANILVSSMNMQLLMKEGVISIVEYSLKYST